MRRALPLIAILLLAHPTLAQNTGTGLPPFGSFEGSQVDIINRQNLNAHLTFPIVSSPGRGTNFSLAILYDSLAWNNIAGAWYPATNALGNVALGWNTQVGTGTITYGASTARCRVFQSGVWGYEYTTLYSGYTYQDARGTNHPFGISFYADATDCHYPTGPVTAHATDNTGYYLDATYAMAPVVRAPNGAVLPSNVLLTDSNGNQISQTAVGGSETDWYDSADHLALKAILGTGQIQYEYPDTSGTYQIITLKETALSIKTNFGCSGIAEYTGSISVPTELDLPNGQKYVFTYESYTSGGNNYYTGRLQQVTLPTGGSYTYTYTGANGGINCADGTILNMSRAISDGTNSYTTQFARTGSTGNWTTTITYPTMPYDSAPNNAAYSFNSAGQQTSAKFYQGTVSSGNLKRTVNSTWSGFAPATQVTVLEDGITQNETETSFDSYGNLLSLKEHDWGTNAPGSILRTTAWTYLNTTPYITANILNGVTNVTVTDNVLGVVHSRTDIAYDETNYTNYGTCNSGVAQHDDTNYGCSFTTRGNPTTVTTYTNAAAPSGSITHHSYYDNLGNLVKADLDCCQSKTWVYSATTKFSYPDSATRGSSPGTQLTTSATYNQSTGLVATSTDENSQKTTYTYDSLKRLTNLQRPDLANLTWTYNDATPPTQSSVTAGVPIQSSNVQNTTTTVDGLGRPITQQISDGTTTYSIVATQYDPLGRAYKGSNPYTSSALYWTTAQFDVLGRSTITNLPDNSQTTFSYSTNTATVTDPAQKARKSVVDGLGRMTSVYEPDPNNSNSLTLQTSYTYNILDLLTGVSQGLQTRTYVYDDLGRVNKTTTPEAGTVCFGTYSGSTCQTNGYDSFGNLLYRTDARGVLTTYGYDNLNRLSGITYNVGSTGVTATPGVTLTYDAGGAAAYALGRLTSMIDGVGSETYSYNNLGEMTQLQKVVGTTTYTTGYAYNLAGELRSITYPSSRVVQQSFDTIGRLCAVGNSGSTCSTGTTFATGFAYNAAFQVTGFNYGNGVAAAFGYTADRLLLQSLAYTKGSTTLFSANYWYKTDATNCPNGAAGNNGQIQCITDNVDSGRNASYAYDALYRLTSAVTKGSTNYPTWGLSMTYDRYGNRTAQSISSGCTGITCPTNSVTVSASTNQLVGSPFAYDANGNMTNDGGNTLVYDAENRMLSATNGSASGTYSYDGNSLRVKKVSGSTTTVYIFSGSKVIAEYVNGAAPSAPTREYIYSGGALLAKIESGATRYFHQDHLSNRVVTDSTGTAVEQLGHFPFGESWYNASSDKLLFTSYERDAESGNDFAMARYSVNRLGRFSSPDVLSGSLGDPQSLNKYAYVLNDPGNLIDPFGLDAMLTCLEDIDGNQTSCSGSGESITVTAGPIDVEIFNDPWSYSPPPLLHYRGGKGGGGGFRFQLIPDSLRLPGESFGDCVNRVQQALLGDKAQKVLNGATGASTIASIFTQPLGTTVTLASASTAPGTSIINTVLKTVPDPRTSIIGRLAATGVQEGATLPSTAAEVTAASGFLGKVSGILTAIGLGIEGGFAISCR